MARRTLIHGGHVVTIDPVLGNLPVGDVLIDDDRIVDVAPLIDCADAERIDAAGMIVCPGFVDTHRHMWQTLLRGVSSDHTLAEYLVTIRLGYGGLYSAEDAYLGNYAGALEALNAGVTTVVDHCHIVNSPAHADGAIAGIAQAGLRAIFCYGLSSSPRHFAEGPADRQAEWRRADARRVRETVLGSNDGLILFGIAPSEVEGVRLESALDEIAFAREMGARTISCHVAMGGHSLFMKPSFVRSLHAEDAIRPDLLFIHGNSLGADELAMIRSGEAAISSIPEVEVQMGMGRPIGGAAARAGVKVGLGVDIVSNIGGDMFHPMRSALSEERGSRNDELVALDQVPRTLGLACRDVVRLGTLGGAECVGLDGQVGSLTVGKQADVVCVSRQGLNMVGGTDPESLLVHFATPGDVDSVWVAGRRMKGGGRLLGLDLPGLNERLTNARRILDQNLEAVDFAPLRRAMRFRNFATPN